MMVRLRLTGSCGDRKERTGLESARRARKQIFFLCSPLLDETRPLHSEVFREKMVQLVSVCPGKLNSLFRAERDFICDLRFGFAPFSTSPSLLAPTRSRRISTRSERRSSPPHPTSTAPALGRIVAR